MNTTNAVNRLIELLSPYTDEKVKSYRVALQNWKLSEELPPLDFGEKLHKIFPIQITGLISEIYYPLKETILYANGNKYRVKIKPIDNLQEGADIITVEGKPYEVVEREKLNQITVTN
ncbi:hypothetical protein PG592_06030 [Riemerella anatipestifer]|uniref:hypothetical protein n=1 Tax=Riemerella anatipestifer TaxID=34085 RepID=UPI0020969DB1|nr:hypothetical protein [Riemerella anatipestifer]MCO7316858.1 hypothetical protein [Riemerella anatipestifer]MCO7324786.1 hypothetical protein [Riemerella anatipestifer]MCQ4037499.1 hypothetical protein [Riemerella anatipestifer]MCQ4063958.1 hypothetical protein [Riemerella anatipestifer]MCQ4157586.1 hypothetical protein [Riemerella anatipestifer]